MKLFKFQAPKTKSQTNPNDLISKSQMKDQAVSFSSIIITGKSGLAGDAFNQRAMFWSLDIEICYLPALLNRNFAICRIGIDSALIG